MKFPKKQQHCMFVEEETYNWASESMGIGKRALAIGFVITLMFIIFVSLES